MTKYLPPIGGLMALVLASGCADSPPARPNLLLVVVAGAGRGQVEDRLDGERFAEVREVDPVGRVEVRGSSRRGRQDSRVVDLCFAKEQPRRDRRAAGREGVTEKSILKILLPTPRGSGSAGGPDGGDAVSWPVFV